MKSKVRIILGLVASIAMLQILDVLISFLDVYEGITSIGEMMLVQAITTVVSFTIGGWIAGKAFLYPALSLAFVAVVYGIALSFWWGIDFNDVSWERLVMNLSNAVIIPAAAIGAMFGMSLAARSKRNPATN